MREFFRGWKSKIGVLTLTVACVFAAGWVRSGGYCDFVVFPYGDRTLIRIASWWGRFGCRVSISDEPDEHSRQRTFIWHSDSIDPSKDDGIFWTPAVDTWMKHVDWQLLFWGFHVGRTTHEPFNSSGFKTYILTIPYWACVVPLTFISAWCLLTKPRIKPSTKPEPAHA